MFALRRAGARALLAQPARQLSTYRPAARVLAVHVDKPSLCRSFHQSRLWLAEEDAKRSEASPADATTSGETVTTEPSAEEQEIREESVATPDVVESASSAGEGAAAQAQETAQEAVSQTQDAASEVAAQTQQQVQEASSQAQSTASSTVETISNPASSAAQTVQNAASDAAETVQNAASSAAETASDTLQRPRRQNPPSKTLYVGNLLFEVTRPQLEAEFGKFGEILNSRIVLDGRGLSKGFGYVEFADQQSADRALKELDQQVLQGRRMSVQYHLRRELRTGRGSFTPNEPTKTLFVGNMSYQMSDRDLNDLFREIRNVLDVRVAIDRRSGQPRGFAHADFIDIESAKKAKAHLEQKVVYGRPLRIDFSHSSSANTRS